MEAGGILAALIAVLAVLVLPGLPASLVLRLRPLTAAAFAAPLSMAVVAVSAELGRLLGLAWNLLVPLATGLLLALGLSLVTRPWRRRRLQAVPGQEPSAPPAAAEPDTSRRWWPAAVAGGLLIGGGVLVLRQLRIMGSITAVSQTYDNVFHLSAVRHILRHQDASAWLVGGMNSLPGNESFYPALWHQLGSLVVQLSGQDLVLVSNVQMLVVGCIVFPVALMALVRGTTTAGPLGVFLTGALVPISSAFPLTMMSWGIILPYLLSLCVLPLALLAIAQIIGLVPNRPDPPPRLTQVVLLIASCFAVAIAHPQGALVALALGLPMMVWATGLRWREGRTEPVAGTVHHGGGLLGGRWPLTVVTVLGLAGGAAVWYVARPGITSAVWEPNASLVEAIGQVGSLAGNATPAWEPLGVVMAAAVLSVALLSRSRWMLLAFLSGAFLSVATRATPVGELRYLITGGFYSDNNRIAAIPVLIAVPILAVGIDAAARWAWARWGTGREDRGPRHARLAPVAAVLIAASLLTLSWVAPNTRVNEGYSVFAWQEPELLSADERELLERLPEVVEPGEVIATNAWNGSSLAYAISDRDVLNIYMGFEAEPEVHLLNAELDEANTNPEVCDAAAELDVEYALDFGPREMHGKRATYTGLNEISETGAAEVVLQVGEAKLLKMLPCRGVDGSMNG